MDGNAFRKYSADKLRQYTSRIQVCLGKLSSDRIWLRNSENENAVGNLILHLCGNVRQWIGSGVAGLPEVRDRDAEFEARGGMETEALAALLESIAREAASQIESVSDEQLQQITQVQRYTVTKLEAIFHMLTHFAEHTGQIIFATKLLTGEDLGFYAHLKNPAHKETVP